MTDTQLEHLYAWTLFSMGTMFGLSVTTFSGYLWPWTIAPKPWVPDAVFGALFGGMAVASILLTVGFVYQRVRNER